MTSDKPDDETPPDDRHVCVRASCELMQLMTDPRDGANDEYRATRVYERGNGEGREDLVADVIAGALLGLDLPRELQTLAHAVITTSQLSSRPEIDPAKFGRQVPEAEAAFVNAAYRLVAAWDRHDGKIQ